MGASTEPEADGRIAPVSRSYTASDGKIVLTLTPADEGGFVVTSPLEPELITEAETIEDAFRMAREALRGLRASRTKLLRKLAVSRRRA
jgi:antitoxin HicB